MTKQLVGKRKINIDRAGYFNIPRSMTTPGNISPEYANKLVVPLTVNMPPETAAYIVFLSELGETDYLRAALGKSWELGTALHTDNHIDPAMINFFGHEWTPLNLFLGNPVTLETCQEVPLLGSIDQYGFDQVYTREKLVIKCDTSNLDSGALKLSLDISEWGAFVKTGISEFGTNKKFPPLVDTGRIYYDHSHESVNPFDSEELLTMQPAGHASFANYTTYYNERLRSGLYESAVTSDISINKLPSIYGFLQLLDILSYDDQVETLNNVNDYLWDYAPPMSEYGGVVLPSGAPTNAEQFVWPPPQLPPPFGATSYTATAVESEEIQELFGRYPLVIPLSLYGQVGYQNLYPSGAHTWSPWQKQKNIINKIIFANTTIHKNQDLDALYEVYFEAYAKFLSTNYYANFGAHARGNYMERLGSNLIFNPDATRHMFSDAEKIKKHMPYYCELEFTTDPDSILGKFMEDTFMTKPLATHIAASSARSIRRYWGEPPGSIEPYSDYDLSEPYLFVEIKDSALYKDPSLFDVIATEAELAAGTSGIPKKVIDLPALFEAYAFGGDGPTYFDDYLFTDFDDVRNFISYVSTGLEEPYDVDKNPFLKIWQSWMFYSEIIKTYNKYKRSYRDILDGKLAYAEDLFYKIEKRRRVNPFAAAGGELNIQNIIIPNIPGVDVIKYVDTQLKYDQRYVYSIYAIKAVFGSKYHYKWTENDSDQTPLDYQTDTYAPWLQDGTGQIEPGNPAVVGDPATDTDIIYAGLSGQTFETGIGYKELAATFVVTVEPSIKLVEDKIYETDDVIILDAPPPAPDVNILPYYAVNNRIKIVLDGVVARYRDQPVSILSTDTNQIGKMLTAQNSPDGKLNFGADDSANKFQIFRITEKPTSYLDFELHPDIASTVGNVYEEEILPNKKYYYTFRAVDTHNHFSNPTYVYEIELIDEHGAVRPLIRTWPLEPKKQKEDIKDFQKYIYIKPSISRLLATSAGTETNTIFSEQNNKKRFKMRFISKTSGKKLDVNFSVHKKQTSII